MKRKAFIKPFEAPQRSVKIKIEVKFIVIQLYEMHRAGRVNVNTNTQQPQQHND